MVITNNSSNYLDYLLCFCINQHNGIFSKKQKGRIYKIEPCKICGSDVIRLNKARNDALYVWHEMYLTGEVKVEDGQTCNEECNNIDTM